MKKIIEKNFGLMMILACVAGLVVPGMPAIPSEAAAVALAVLMFVSSYKLRDGGFSSIRWRDVWMFWLLRYVLLPPALWLIATFAAPNYALAVLLISVVPAAVSSPAFAGIYGGIAAPAFAIVVVSQMLTPLLIPLQFMAIGSTEVTPSPAHLFTTLLVCIVLPMIVYALVRRHRPSADYFYRQNKFFSILLIMFVIALAIAKQRDVILANPAQVIAPLIICLVCYMIYIASAWFLSKHRTREERVTYATCSAFNNAALAVSLGLMHFPPEVVLFVAASEIGWALLPGMMRGWLKWELRN